MTDPIRGKIQEVCGRNSNCSTIDLTPDHQTQVNNSRWRVFEYRLALLTMVEKILEEMVEGRRPKAREFEHEAKFQSPPSRTPGNSMRTEPMIRVLLYRNMICTKTKVIRPAV